jgi:hypothetical protein
MLGHWQMLNFDRRLPDFISPFPGISHIILRTASSFEIIPNHVYLSPLASSQIKHNVREISGDYHH